MSNYLRKLGVFHTPPPLCVPQDATLTGYVINTNGLKPTTLYGDDSFDKGRLRNKINILRDTIMEYNVDVLHVTETHDTTAVLTTPTDVWSCHASTAGVKSQGAATMSKLMVKEASGDTNVSQIQVSWEKEVVWMITAYFPNNLKETIATTKAVDAMLRQKHGARIILAGDFNSTRTLASEDAGGTLPPQESRQSKAMLIQEYLSANSFMDLWNTFQNNNRDREMDHLSHLTHWNHNHTRGARLDRIYANFQIDGVLNVTTRPHPGSDHKAVKLEWSNIPLSGQVQKDPSLPHRTYDLPQVKSLVIRLPCGIHQFTTYYAQNFEQMGCAEEKYCQGCLHPLENTCPK